MKIPKVLPSKTTMNNQAKMESPLQEQYVGNPPKKSQEYTAHIPGSRSRRFVKLP